MAATAPGMATAAVDLEARAIDDSFTPQISTSNNNETNEKAARGDAGDSANTSPNHLQTPAANGKDFKKKRPLFWGQDKAVKLDEKGLQPTESRLSDGDTNTTATKTGKEPDGNGNGTQPPEEAPTPLVPFFSLYRFHKRYEVVLNIFGLVCACASGASQVRNLSARAVPLINDSNSP